MKRVLLRAPIGQIDPIIFPLIEKWDEPPKALQILRVLDECNKYQLASELALHTIMALFRIRMFQEDITEEELIKQAFWRIS